MKQPITVYWMCGENEWIRAAAPERVSQKLFSPETLGTVPLNYCPASNRALSNVYSVKSIYDYSFTIKNGEVASPDYDQEFFNNHIIVRSVEKRIFSFVNQYAFFTDEPSLEITAYEHPTFEQNEVSKRCMPIKGQYDIGKWFRPLEFPFILKEEFDTFTVKDQDVLYYLKFHTNRPIKFKQFYLTDNLKKLLDSSVASTFHKTGKFNNLEAFYNMFKVKKYLLKEIKSSLL